MSNTAITIITVALLIKAFTRLLDFKLLDVFCASQLFRLSQLYT